MTAAVNQRYTAVAIALHWLIAVGIIGMIALGWYMTALPQGSLQFDLFQLHKSIGVTILLLSIARVVWRLMNPPPPEPPMPGWQRALALFVHVGFYVLIIAMPLSGWIMASAAPSSVGTTLYGTIAWPHVPGLAELPRETKDQLHEPLVAVHGYLAWVAIGLLVLHLAGALKHQFIDRDALIARMAPGIAGRTDGPPQKGRGLVYALGAALLIFAAATGYAMIGSGRAALVSSQDEQGPPTSQAASWTVDPARSSIAFKGAYMGRPFEGRFKDWTSTIQFDPAKPEDARIRVVVKTGTADTGEPYFNDNLKEGDWFNASKHPDAVFSVTQGVSKQDDTRYEATGVLNLKGTDYPLRLPFTLIIEGTTAKMHAEIPMSRLALTIGRDTNSAAKGDEEYVADEVRLVVDVVAQRQ